MCGGLLGNRQAEVCDFPDLMAGPREAVVLLKAGGLCSSDLHLYHQSAEERAGNTIPGHESIIRTTDGQP